MFKVKLIQKTRNKNGDSKKEVKSVKQIKKNNNYQSLTNELSKTFNIPINNIILMVLTEDEDEYPINDQDDLDSYIEEAREFLIIYEIDSIQNKKVNSNILDQVNFQKKELTLKGKDNKLYNLIIINEQDEITFKSNIINNIWDIQYSINVNIKGFYEINKIFRKYKSINEIYSKYFNDIKEEQINISSSNNKIIIYFNDNDEVKIPFILEPNEMKMDNIIRKLCDKMENVQNELDNQKRENASLKKELEKRRNDDENNKSEYKKEIKDLKNSIKIIAKLCGKMGDIDKLKTELGNQKIENANLKKELERRINDDDKNISELRKEIENLNKSINSSINQKELDDILEVIFKDINQMKNDIDKQNKNKIYQGFQDIIEESKINEFSIITQEKKLELIDEKNDILFNSMILDEEDIDDDYQKPIFIEFEKDKYEINNINSRYFEIKNIKITNIGSKEYNQLYFVIDTYNSSKDLLFNNLFSKDTYRTITLDGPLQKGESLINNVYFIFYGHEFRENTFFIYVRENINGENLSLPLKIIVHSNEDPEEKGKREETEEKRKREETEEKREIEEEAENEERGEDKEVKIQKEKYLNFDFKGLDKKEVCQIYEDLDNELNLSSMFDKEEIIEIIIENNCDLYKIKEWICGHL